MKTLAMRLRRDATGRDGLNRTPDRVPGGIGGAHG